MTEAEEWSFPTKGGRCTISQDRIVLARSGWQTRISRALGGPSGNRNRAMMVLVIVIGAGLGVAGILQGHIAQSLLGFSAALLMLWGMLQIRGASNASEISRAAILRVEAHRPIPLVVAGHFIVHFTENGLLQKRLIILPGWLGTNDAEFQSARALLRSSGVMPSRE